VTAALQQEADEYASAFLARVAAGTASPDDLATLVDYLDGDMRRAFCRRVQEHCEAAHA